MTKMRKNLNKLLYPLYMAEGAILGDCYAKNALRGAGNTIVTRYITDFLCHLPTIYWQEITSITTDPAVLSHLNSNDLFTDFCVLGGILAGTCYAYAENHPKVPNSTP
jgi:hypothetical protein